MTQISEELMMKFITNRCSNEELRMVQQWIDESEDNARQIFELERIAMLAESLKTDKHQYDRVWNSINDKISEDKLQHNRLRRIRILRWSTAAAVFVGILLGSIFILRQPKVEMIELTADNGTMTITLPDSTKVWLNRYASITYPTTFADDRRSVSISGEAYFEVTHDISRPFTVDGKWLNVTVLGTKFNFNSSEDKENTVSLIEGKIEVTPGKNKDGVVLSPGQKVQFNPQNGRMSISQVNTALDAVWHNRLIRFHNATIAEIAADLEELYGVEVTIRNSVDNSRTYSGSTVYYQSVDSTLEALSETIPFDFSYHGYGIIISDKK